VTTTVYRYAAIDRQGRRLNGCLPAADANALQERLAPMRLDVLHVKPVSGWQLRWQGCFTRLRGGTRRRELLEFYVSLEQLIAAGVPLIEALSDLLSDTQAPVWQDALIGVLADLHSGQPLSSAMASQDLFGRNSSRGKSGTLTLHLIEAGELSGRLPQMLQQIIDTLKWQDELAAGSKKLLIYPLFAAGVVLSTCLFLLLWLAPQLESFIATLGQEYGWTAKLLFDISAALRNGGWLWLLLPSCLLAVVMGMFFYGGQSVQMWFDRHKLKLPLVGGIYKKIIISRFLQAFAQLYAAGIPIQKALNSARRTICNRAVDHALQQSARQIEAGTSLASALGDSGLLQALALRMIKVGEHTGDLDGSLRQVSYFYSRDIKESIEQAQAILEPALILILGALLAFVALSVMLPIYEALGGLH